MFDLRTIPKSIVVLVIVILLSVWPSFTDLFDIGNVNKVAESIHTYTNALSAAEEVLNAN